MKVVTNTKVGIVLKQSVTSDDNLDKVTVDWGQLHLGAIQVLRNAFFPITWHPVPLDKINKKKNAKIHCTGTYQSVRGLVLPLI